jgi:uncharacterized membrane protein HdeD (DUF308 family)
MSTFSTSRTGFLISGILFTILGLLALRYSYASTIIGVQILGAFYTAAGLAELFYAFKSSGTKSVLWRFALGIIYLAIGLFMLIKPLANAVSLTLILSLLIAATGIYRIYDAIVHNVPYRIWRIINGIISIIIGIMLWMQWPYSGIWFIGMLLGIELLVSGLTSIAIALFADN